MKIKSSGINDHIVLAVTENLKFCHNVIVFGTTTWGLENAALTNRDLLEN